MRTAVGTTVAQRLSFADEGGWRDQVTDQERLGHRAMLAGASVDQRMLEALSDVVRPGPMRSRPGQYGTLRSANQTAGSIARPLIPPRRISKCRCGPVENPSLPTFAITSPARTVSPASTKR